MTAGEPDTERMKLAGDIKQEQEQEQEQEQAQRGNCAVVICRMQQGSNRHRNMSWRTFR